MAKKKLSKLPKWAWWGLWFVGVSSILFLILYSFARMWRTNNNSPINIGYGISFVDSVYGVKIEFPADIKNYKSKEYKWPSHVHAYNPLFEKTFATEDNKFGYYTGDFYLSDNDPVTLGNLISYKVYDEKNCNHRSTDPYEIKFCNKYVYTAETSGVTTDDYKPYSYWIRNYKYVVVFGIVGEDIQSANSKYKLSVQ